ncbi:hypothetical protein FSP39_014133 [Pinctada imbricata]|uniref:Ion transport domain-containing protein n=1 Tax=Pinctada imbricata TaxID=66713 RepID=A0AA88XKS3_PINIB|nr:hypothetical protein FSP39_014133 [Pinctada imbricata]
MSSILLFFFTYRKKFSFQKVLAADGNEKSPHLISSNLQSQMAQCTCTSGVPDSNKHTESLRQQLFDAVLENDVSIIENVIDSINKHMCISKLLTEENYMNALNFAIEHGKFDAAKYLIEISNDDMLLNEFFIQEPHTVRTALHQLTITTLIQEDLVLSLAQLFLHKVNDKLKALTEETRYDVKSKRQRTFPCLHLASLLGKKQLVELYLETGQLHGLTINQRNSKHDTALHWSSRSGHSAIVEYLLNNQADPNIGNDIHTTPLHWAVKYQKREVIEILLNDQRTDVNKVRCVGFSTPLIIASKIGSKNIVELLLAKNADGNVKDPSGKTALHIAIENGHSDVVKLLLGNNTEMTIEDNNGDKAMTTAARKGQADIVLYLLQQNDNPFTKNHMGHDVWYYAYENNDDAVLSVLIDHFLPKAGISTSVQCSVSSILFQAASLGKCKQIETILDRGVSAEITDSEGNSFLHYAAENDQVEVIQTFCKFCDMNIQNKVGITPLHRAVMLHNIKSIRALIRVGVNAAIKDVNGRTVLHLAAMHNLNAQLVQELVAYIINVHSWEDLNAEDENGNNALHIAAEYRRSDLLWEFRHISLYAQNKKGNTPFHLSVHVDSPHVLEKTLDVFEVMDQKGNINEQNLKGESILHLAVCAGIGESVKRLVHLKGDLCAMDINGDTPLHRLVKETVNLTDDCYKQNCLKTLDVIIKESPVWFCKDSTFKTTKVHGHSSELNSKAILQRHRRQSLTYLLHFPKNKEHLSVFALSFAIGAHEFLSTILELDSVKSFSDKEFCYNDVSEIIHLSRSGFLEKNYMHWTSDLSSPIEICGIEMLSHVKDTSRVSKILDIPVIKYIEKVYGKMTRLVFTVLLLLHFLYMATLSLVGLEISSSFRNENSTFSPSGFTGMGFYCILPLEPLILLLFATISMYLESAVHRRELRKSMIPYYVIYIAFSLTIIIWMGLVLAGIRLQDYILAVCLCGGWLYMIALIHVIPGMHLFWRMLKYMVMKDVILFLVVYLIVLFAFTTAFHVLFQISNSISEMYEHWADTAFLIFNLMLGMGELFDENFTPEMKAVSKNAGLAKVLFVGYTVLTTIILLNMLIATMNNTYNKFESRKGSYLRMDTILMGNRIERYLPVEVAKNFYRYLGIELMEIPGEEKGLIINGNLVQKFFLKRSKKEDLPKKSKGYFFGLFPSFFEKVSDDKEDPFDEIQEQVGKLSTELHVISKKVDILLKRKEDNMT